MAGSEVVILDTSMSLFSMRVRIALAEKGIEYERREEDLTNKSSLLLQMNPVHKRVPVLIHHRKPIESTIIVQYIDEAWQNNSPPFLPSDPYLRAHAKFWADFIDKKICDVRWRIWSTKGEELERAKKEFIDGMKVLEGELEEKPYLMGESFGYVDIVMVPLCSSLYALEKIGNINIEKECPKIVAWAKRCMERECLQVSC